MSKLSAMPVFFSDFFADTEHLSPDAAKAYLFLLGHAWIRGAKLPNDDTMLARLARVSLKSWRHMKDGVVAFWTLGEDGYLRQKRLSKEYEYVCRKVEVNRENGSAGGKASASKKANENNKTTVANAQPPTLTPNKKEKDNLTVIPKERGTRLPDNFEPDETCHALAKELLLSKQETQQALDEFRDYWRGVPGARGVKIDWQATFRNQLRRQKGKSNGANPQANSSRSRPQRNSIHDSIAVVRAALVQRIADERGEGAGSTGQGNPDAENVSRFRQDYATDHGRSERKAG